MSLLPMPDTLLFESLEIILVHVRDADTRAGYVVIIKRSVANRKVIVGRVHGGQ
jgi:hypothetical protein